ncbi:MAG TPA: alpha/beta hydrolase [Actinomycetes bacterium]|nr:alpha/beta hydrolase [Actinomycetes bacterium]
MSPRPAAPPPIGRVVDVGGYLMHLACRGEGGPTVVMEAGLGETGLMWSLVQPAVAQLTRACVYDRAGYGWSDPSPRPRTAAVMVEELHQLLGAAGVPRPYVLVGHSFGGLLVRLHAARYPQEVAGLVLVDSAHEQQYQRAPAEIQELVPQFEQQVRQQSEGLKVLIVSGSLDPAMLPVPPQLPAAAAETFRALVASGPKHVDTFIAEQQAVGAIHRELAAAGITSLGDLPLVVLSHGQPMAMPGLAPEVNQAYEQHWQELQAKLAGLSSPGTTDRGRR